LNELQVEGKNRRLRVSRTRERRNTVAGASG
jgi:hypothetical protein